MLKTRASPPCVVKGSLYRLPCGVRSLRDKLPKLPCNAKSPSKTLDAKLFYSTWNYFHESTMYMKNEWRVFSLSKMIYHTHQTFPNEQIIFHSLAFSVWFSLVSHRQNIKRTKMFQQKKPCGSCHSFHWLEITSVKSSLLQLFLNTLWFGCTLLSYWAVWSSAQISRGESILSLLLVNPPFMFVSRKTASCLFMKPSSAYNAQHSWLQELI